MKYTIDEKLEIGKAICELYGEGRYTLESCCKKKGISVRSFTRWRKDLSDLSDAYAIAKKESSEAYKFELKEKAMSSLLKAIQGQVVTTTKSYYDKNGNLKSKVIIEKEMPINVTALIFVLKNVSPIFSENKKDDSKTMKIEVDFTGYDYSQANKYVELDAIPPRINGDDLN